MARDRSPIVKQSRREGVALHPKAHKILARKSGIPGEHAHGRQGKQSMYATQLREKQKIRYMYGLNERQFYNTFIKASKMKGVTGDNFLGLLESRLDNLVYRMGFARTRRAARQLVNHGHVLVNGKKVDIPSFIAKPGMVVEIKEKSRDMKAINEALEATLNTVAFIDVDKDAKKGTYLRLPERSELNSEFNELLVVEFYNR